jgi:hypothetical protein
MNKLKNFFIGFIINSILFSAYSIYSINQYGEFRNSIIPFEKTQYDFFVSNLGNQNNIDLLRQNNSTKNLHLSYNFSLNVSGGKRGNVLFSIENEGHAFTFYDSTLLISGSYNRDAVVIDTTFAKSFNLIVGQTLNLNLNGNNLNLPISGIFLSSNLDTFNNGIAITSWKQNYSNFFNNDIIPDIGFVESQNSIESINLFNSLDFSYSSRVEFLQENENTFENKMQQTISTFLMLLSFSFISTIFVNLTLLFQYRKMFSVLINELDIKDRKKSPFRSLKKSYLFNTLIHYATLAVIYLLFSNIFLASQLSFLILLCVLLSPIVFHIFNLVSLNFFIKKLI